MGGFSWKTISVKHARLARIKKALAMTPHRVLPVQEIIFHWLAVCPGRRVTAMHGRL